MRILAGLTVWSVVCLYAGPVLACGSTASRYTFESISPSDGARGFPQNGAIQLRFEQDDAGKTSGSARLVVRVARVDTGEVASGTLVGGRVDTSVNRWVPTAPLAPDAEYRIEVSTTESDGSDARLVSSSIFRTSSESAGELQLAGQLRAAIRVGTMPDCSSTNDCGACIPDRDRPALYAELELPQVSGGFDAYGYAGALTLNGDAVFVTKAPERPESRVTVQTIDMQPNMANTVRWELRRADRPYAMCFGLSVSDPIGQVVEADVTCFSEMEVQAAFAELDAKRAQPSMPASAAVAEPREDSAAADEEDEAASEADSTEPERHAAANCSALPGTRHSDPFESAIAAFVLLGILGYRKRRSTKAFRR